MRTLAHAGMVLLTLFVCSSCRPAMLHPAELILAASLPLSAEEAPLGDAWRRGYERAVADVNHAGGLLLESTQRRVLVVLRIEDDRGDVVGAERAAERLLDAGVQALLATPGLTRMAAQAAIAQRHARPYVVPATAGPELKASARPWVLVSPEGATGDEDEAYLTAASALAAVGRAPSLDPEAVRRTFVTKVPFTKVPFQASATASVTVAR